MLRVKGRGVADKAASGDLLVKVQVVVPQRLSDAARKAVEALRRRGRPGPTRAPTCYARAREGLSPMAGDGELRPPATRTPVFVISVAAQLAGMHPQTLRQYDRLGLVSPSRTRGGGRRYSARDVARLREVQRLSQDEGISLAGIQRILELENQVAALQSRVAELTARSSAARAAMATGSRVFAAGRGGDVVARPRRSAALPHRQPSQPWSSRPAPEARHLSVRGPPAPGPSDSFHLEVERNRLNFGRC